MKQLSILFCIAAVALSIGTKAQIITTIAGSGTAGYSGDGGSATTAELSVPTGVAIDASGNVYVADHGNNRVRRISASGIITTIAGTGIGGYSGDGGPATSAQLNIPTGVAVDGSGNVYIADGANDCIRKVNTSGIITTIAGGTGGYSGDGGPATAAGLSDPYEVAVDGGGNVYIVDYGNDCIRKVNIATGIITTIAGTGTQGYSGDGGPATSAQLNNPFEVAIDGSGNVYIADAGNNRVRKINTSGIISTIAGNGTAGYGGDHGSAIGAELNYPAGVAADGSGNIYIADNGNACIRKVNTISGNITTIAGNDTAGYKGDGGAATAAELNNPIGLAAAGSGNVYIADDGNNRIRMVAGSTAVTMVKSNNTFKVFISPNPTNNNAELHYSGAPNEKVSVNIKDVTGKVVYNTTIAGRSGSIIMSLQSLAAGNYIVITHSGEDMITSRLIKE